MEQNQDGNSSEKEKQVCWLSKIVDFGSSSNE